MNEKKKRKHLTKEQKENLKNICKGAVIGLGMCSLAAIPAICAINRKYNSDIYSDFASSGGPKVYNNEVTEMVKKHSTIWDRLNPGKMVDMVFMAFDILNGSVEKPKKENWKFKFHREDGNDFLISDALDE